MFAFSAAQLRQTLSTLPPVSGYLVALSGGLDSTVLLHALTQSQSGSALPLRAIHINHGLHPAAASWTRFCQDFCERLHVPLITLSVDATAPKGESPEDWARSARYGAVAEQMLPDELVLTAHHQDDQAETLLLQLLRGAGPAGLAAMASFRKFHCGWIGRPLLKHARQELHAYAAAENLNWVDDSSNCDLRFDRNYLRVEVLPRLRARWPRYADTLARAAKWQADANTAIDVLAAEDLKSAETSHAAAFGMPTPSLLVSALRALPQARMRHVLRLWVKESGLPMPAATHLSRVVMDVLESGCDRNPHVSWSGAEIRRYRDAIYLGPPLAPVDSAWSIQRAHMANTFLHQRGGLLQVMLDMKSASCRSKWRDWPIWVRYRQGGEVCRPYGAAHRITLKNLWQQHGVPPWLRDRWPLIFVDQELAAVPNLAVCEPFCGTTGTELRFSWQPELRAQGAPHLCQAPEEK